jgi:tRNA threonylcarbamoyl adenosine modification protein (Sua5/YciO/YrdC/YwlC family)
LLKNNTPGAYTFILPATKEVPRRLMNEKRKTIGIRIPKNAVIDAIIEELNEPIMSCTLILPGKDEAESDSVSINGEIGNQVDLIVDCGQIAPNMTTVVSFEDGNATVVRYGAGDASSFE